MEVHRPGGQLHFFDRQTGESRRQLEEAKRNLMDFTKSHGVVMAAQQRDLILRRLDDEIASYQQTQVEMSGTEHRVQELNEQLEKLPERTTTQGRTAENPERLRALKTSLLDHDLKGAQLLTKFERNHRTMRQIAQEVLVPRGTM